MITESSDIMARIRSLRNFERNMAVITMKHQERQARREYLEDLHRAYVRGEVSIDPDDERTTAGLTSSEVAYITGSTCTDCLKAKCECGDDDWREENVWPKSTK